MIQTRREAALAAVLMVLLAGCDSETPMTLERLTARHTEARGGAQAIENVKAVRLQLEITEPGLTMRGDYVATRRGYMRIDIHADGERVFTEALGPDGGWQMLKDHTAGSAISEEGEQALRRGLVGSLYGLHELPGLGYRLKLAGSETRDDRTFWVVDQIAPDGFAKRLFFDAESWLVVRQVETSALHPDLDDARTRQETRLKDYQESEGVLFSRQEEKFDFDKDQIVQTVVIRKIEVNPEIDPAIFAVPVQEFEGAAAEGPDGE